MIKISDFFKMLAHKSAIAISSLIPLGSVIISLLAPMLIAIGTFLLTTVKISWFFADPFSIINGDHIMESWIAGWVIFDRSSAVLITVELTLFVLGTILFLISFFQLVAGLIKKKWIINTGIYKYIRHPQNLGIILLSAPFALYVPIFNDFGIRLGDIVSWIQFVFFMVIYSEIGDAILKKKYPEESQSYFESTGFMAPKLIRITKIIPFLKYRIVKYVILLLMYCAVILIIYNLHVNGKIPQTQYY